MQICNHGDVFGGNFTSALRSYASTPAVNLRMPCDRALGGATQRAQDGVYGRDADVAECEREVRIGNRG